MAQQKDDLVELHELIKATIRNPNYNLVKHLKSDNGIRLKVFENAIFYAIDIIERVEELSHFIETGMDVWRGRTHHGS